MKQFESFSGVAAPLLIDDINTDQMCVASAPAGTNYGDLLFARWRTKSDFVLNHAPFDRASILVTGRNFGSGSSRETAVWALMGFGFRCVIGRSFADIFRENSLKNGLLVLTLSEDDAKRFENTVVELEGRKDMSVDLMSQTVICPRLGALHFEISATEKEALLKGLDDIELSLQSEEEIARWEKNNQNRHPWLQKIGAL